MNHIPVLKNEVLEYFQYLAKDGNYFVDGTLGLAGHSLAIAKQAEDNKDLKFIGIDQDQSALDLALEKITTQKLDSRFILVHNNFKNISEILEELEIDKFDGALLDLGVSSMQFDDKSRGFSFSDPAQILDMRMDKSSNFDAQFIVNNYSREELTEILYKFGEESFAPKIATNIVYSRKKKTIRTIGDLLEVLSESIPKSLQVGRRQHFATKTFQALRIAVNKELDGLDLAITDFANHLKSGGRLAIISFHSLEDRIVKTTFHDLANPCKCPPKLPCVCNLEPSAKIITSKPIVASEQEVSENPRSRSAKLRVVEKL